MSGVSEGERAELDDARILLRERPELPSWHPWEKRARAFFGGRGGNAGSTEPEATECRWGVPNCHGEYCDCPRLAGTEERTGEAGARPERTAETQPDTPVAPPSGPSSAVGGRATETKIGPSGGRPEPSNPSSGTEPRLRLSLEQVYGLFERISKRRIAVPHTKTKCAVIDEDIDLAQLALLDLRDVLLARSALSGEPTDEELAQRLSEAYYRTESPRRDDRGWRLVSRAVWLTDARREVAGQRNAAWLSGLLRLFPALDMAWSDEVRAAWFDCYERLVRLASISGLDGTDKP